MKASEDSPKTPGGISKTLLTPCRRLGLSRKFNRKGPSPFISPLSSGQNSIEISTPIASKKRKILCPTNEESALSSPAPETVLDVPENVAPMSSPIHISVTPSRNVAFSKKNSKDLLLIQDVDNMEKVTENIEIRDNSTQNNNRKQSKLGKMSSRKNIKPHQQKGNSVVLNEIPKEIDTKSNEFKIKDSPVKNPNNLNKKCIVLIQNKMLKNFKSNIKANQKNIIGIDNTPVSQSLFDSDSDDVPLCELNKKLDKKHIGDLNSLIIEKETSNSISNINKTTNSKLVKPIAVKTYLQNSFNNDDDDDFQFVKKRPVLVNKHVKIAKPSKAKSTGSITQNDIDEIKSRIEIKKKLLIAKAMTEDTEELRSLIKKWQKGCQEALFELFDLMKEKLQDNRNMDYLEILKTLKIPPELVGYDIENDCFVTPDDNSIIMSSINT